MRGNAVRARYELVGEASCWAAFIATATVHVFSYSYSSCISACSGCRCRETGMGVLVYSNCLYSCTAVLTNLRLWRRPGQGGLGGLGTPTCVKPDMYSQHLNRRLRLRTLAHPGPCLLTCRRHSACTKTSPLPSKITYIKMDPESCIRNGFANTAPFSFLCL